MFLGPEKFSSKGRFLFNPDFILDRFYCTYLVGSIIPFCGYNLVLMIFKLNHGMV